MALPDNLQNIDVQDLLEKPIWQMTGAEFLSLNQQFLQGRTIEATQNVAPFEKRYVYGLGGIARLFGCSVPTAKRIKQSGKISQAITQIGRKIIVDADMALALAGKKTGGRK